MKSKKNQINYFFYIYLKLEMLDLILLKILGFID